MIKSVAFKQGVTQLRFEGKVIRSGDLSPSKYLQLVGIDPKFQDLFDVTFEETIKPAEDGKETTVRRRASSRAQQSGDSDSGEASEA
jgi:hypothetical protein